MRLSVVPRSAGDLRCAYCHADLDAGKPCPHCATLLHEDCWILAGTCPTLGCRPALRVILREALRSATGASGWHLASWLLVFAAVWAMFTETGLSLPGVTEVLVALSRFARSPLGLSFATLVLVGSVVAFHRARSWP